MNLKDNENVKYYSDQDEDDAEGEIVKFTLPPLIPREERPPKPTTLYGFLEYWEMLANKLLKVARKWQLDYFKLEHKYNALSKLYDQLAKTSDDQKKRYVSVIRAYGKSEDSISQSLGKALGYPWFKDDQENFPGATAENGVCIGDHVAESIAEEAARRIVQLTRRNENLEDELRAWRHAGE